MIPTQLAISVTHGLARTTCNPVMLLLVQFFVLPAIPSRLEWALAGGARVER
jgi:hypothetical protein